jgi:cytoskeletal protein CcmA (bactofilin family)
MPLSKRLFSILAVPLLTVLFCIIAAKPAKAAEFHFTDYTLTQDQTATDDLYITAEKVDVNGLVSGDLIVCANSVTVTGTISGNVYIIAQTIIFKGYAYGNVNLIGNNVTESGNVKGNLNTIGSTVFVDSQVEEDFFGIGYNLQLRGTVGDDARFIGENVYTKTTIEGDLISLSKTADTTDTIVRGNTYTADSIKAIAQKQGVNFDEKVEYTPTTYTFTSADKFYSILFAFCSMSLVGYVMITMTPVKTAKVISKITGSTKDFFLSFGIGFGILVVAPIALIFLCITLVGAPLAFFIFGLLLFLTLFGRLWVEVALGQEVLALFKQKDYRPFKSLAIGRLISVLISLIPFVGFFYSVILMSTSVGAFTRMKFEYWNKAKKK